MFERIWAIIVKEFLQVFRDPRMKFTIFVSPLVQILVFGYAATMDITNIPTAIYDLDNTKESRDVIRAFTYSKYFTVKRYVYNDKEQRKVIDKSLVSAVIRFNRGFARNLKDNKGGELQIILDGTDSNSASIILGYANQIISEYNYKLLEERATIFLKRSDVVPNVELRDRHWFNANLESKNYYLPGVIALIVTIMSLLLTSMAIVREKEIGTIEQLIVSPIKSVELILGKIIPFGIIAITQVFLITMIGVFWFKVPIRGSILLLFGSTVLYMLTTLGVGLFISTLSSTQQEAMMSVFLFNFPATLLSGFAYPIANMPRVIQYITYLNPLRYYLIIMRALFLKGVGIRILWPEMLALLVIGLSIIGFSSLRFQKRIG
ncbi:MAG: ABC transporter permease [Candidatus Omnitrophica bacterium]|nr:ABC transporter permease [Candidatus Omnitrophota bacterium]